MARSYGSGEAERVLGEFARTRRDEITITSKFGIRPVAATRGSAIRYLARRTMRLSPRVRSALGRQGARLVHQHEFSPDKARTSLEASLGELRTDYIDIFLLHEARHEDCSDDLLGFLEEAVNVGKIRAFGVGTHGDGATLIATSAPAFARILQLEHSVLRPNAQRLEPDFRGAVITHGALAGFARLQAYLAGRPGESRRWSDQLGVNCGDDKTLASVMLLYAVHSGGRGPVLFASTLEAHAVANAEAVREDPFSAEQRDGFSRLVRSAGL